MGSVMCYNMLIGAINQDIAGEKFASSSFP